VVQRQINERAWLSGMVMGVGLMGEAGHRLRTWSRVLEDDINNVSEVERYLFNYTSKEREAIGRNVRMDSS
jgi:hypothetical protein